MQMKRNIILGLVFLLTLSLVYASDDCYVDQPCIWYATGNVSQTGVNFTLTYSNSTTVNYGAMTAIDDYYQYNITINVTDTVLGCGIAYNTTETIQTACESKLITNDTSQEALEVGSIAFFSSVVNGAVVFFLIVGMVLWLIFIESKKRKKKNL